MKLVFVFVCLILSFSLSAQNQAAIDSFMMGQVARLSGNTDLALQRYTSAINAFPDPYFIQARSELYWETGNYMLARNDLIRLDSLGWPHAKLMISRSYALETKDKEASIWLQYYLKEKNKLPENLIRTDADFTTLSESKFWDDLWKTDWYCDYEKTVAELMLLLEKNDQSTIFDVVETAVKAYPDSAMIWFFRAKTYLAGNNPKESLKSLSKALSISPLYLDALNLRIQIYKSTGKVPKAVEDAKTVIQIDPYNYSYRKALAGMEIEAGNYQDAIEHLDQYLKYFTNDHESVYMQGQAAFLMKKYDLALEKFSAAFSMNRKSSVYVMERGKCYLEKGMYDEAFNDLCAALDLDPRNGEGFYTRGLVCFQKGDRIGACRDWNKAKSLGFLKAEDYILSVCGGVNN